MLKFRIPKVNFPHLRTEGPTADTKRSKLRSASKRTAQGKLYKYIYIYIYRSGKQLEIYPHCIGLDLIEFRV